MLTGQLWEPLFSSRSLRAEFTLRDGVKPWPESWLRPRENTLNGSTETLGPCAGELHFTG